MPQFLIEDATTQVGYSQVNRAQGQELGNDANGVPYLPWGITLNGDVIYKPDCHNFHDGHTWHARRYTAAIYSERRTMCESHLGMIALNHAHLLHSAVDEVSNEILRYLRRQAYRNGRDAVEGALHRHIGKYYHTGGRNGFGRFDHTNIRSVTPGQFYRTVVERLQHGRLDERISLHDAIGRKILPRFHDPLAATYARVGAGLREAWFDDEDMRGRSNVQPRPAANNAGGTAPVGAHVPATAIQRNRGVDMFQRDMNVQLCSGNQRFFHDVDALNLGFGASISGTTGTALQAALAFANLQGEELKKYFFAIVGYLVGGGMHTFHESAEVARRVGRGLNYVQGTFDHRQTTLLPNVIRYTQDFQQWREEYYDIAVLGGRFWIQHAPREQRHSTLNPNQRNAIDLALSNVIANRLAPTAQAN